MSVKRCSRIKRLGALCLAPFAAFALPVFAQTAAQQSTQQTASNASTSPSVLPMVIVLIFVLALIPIAIWLLKKVGAGMPSASAGLRVIGQLPLGQRERIVIVEAGERWLLLGVTATSINRVGTLPKGAVPAAQTPQTIATFATLLAKLNKPGSGSSA